MSSPQKLFNQLFFFFLINNFFLQTFSQETNQTEKVSNNTDNIDNIDNQNNTHYNQRHKYNSMKSDTDKNRPYNLTYDEMDTMMFCSIIIQEALRTKKKEIEEITKKLNLSSTNPVYDKIGTDIFEQCNKKAGMDIVNKYIRNLTYLNNFKWEKNFDNFATINFTKYNNQSDLILTQSQRVLMYLYQRVDELFRQKRADKRDEIEQENQKIKIGNLDMDSIPNSFKFGALLIVIILLFGGVFYFLKQMQKKPKDKKKNKKKKMKSE
jgi:hypothetical protein